MKPFVTLLSAIIICTLLTSCTHQSKPADQKVAPGKKANNLSTDNNPQIIKFTDQQLELFLDSIGHLSTQALAGKEAFYADSVFKNQRHMDTLISSKDLDVLKRAIRKGRISVATARRIFNNPQIDSSCTEKSIFLNYKQGFTPIAYYPFGKDKAAFDEYGICIGDPDHCEDACLYFFKGSKIIEMHYFYERFSPGLWHYKDSDGKTVIYYIYMFAEGSGEWWFNYFFYKYDGDHLIPVLNELQNGNVAAPIDRGFWLESDVLKTNPLTIKMVYHDELPEDTSFDAVPSIIKDSTTVQYSWNEASKTFQGQYQQSKISKAQILSYDLPGNHLLFVNSHYRILKDALRDKTKRKRVLQYLSKIKNGRG